MGNVRSRNRAIVLFIRVNGVGNAMAAVVAQRGAKGASAGILMGRVAVAGGQLAVSGSSDTLPKWPQDTVGRATWKIIEARIRDMPANDGSELSFTRFLKPRDHSKAEMTSMYHP